MNSASNASRLTTPRRNASIRNTSLRQSGDKDKHVNKSQHNIPVPIQTAELQSRQQATKSLFNAPKSKNFSQRNLTAGDLSKESGKTRVVVGKQNDAESQPVIESKTNSVSISKYMAPHMSEGIGDQTKSDVKIVPRVASIADIVLDAQMINDDGGVNHVSPMLPRGQVDSQLNVVTAPNFVSSDGRDRRDDHTPIAASINYFNEADLSGVKPVLIFQNVNMSQTDDAMSGALKSDSKEAGLQSLSAAMQREPVAEMEPIAMSVATRQVAGDGAKTFGLNSNAPQTLLNAGVGQNNDNAHLSTMHRVSGSIMTMDHREVKAVAVNLQKQGTEPLQVDGTGLAKDQKDGEEADKNGVKRRKASKKRTHGVAAPGQDLMAPTHEILDGIWKKSGQYFKLPQFSNRAQQQAQQAAQEPRTKHAAVEARETTPEKLDFAETQRIISNPTMLDLNIKAEVQNKKMYIKEHNSPNLKSTLNETQKKNPWKIEDLHVLSHRSRGTASSIKPAIKDYVNQPLSSRTGQPSHRRVQSGVMYSTTTSAAARRVSETLHSYKNQRVSTKQLLNLASGNRTLKPKKTSLQGARPTTGANPSNRFRQHQLIDQQSLTSKGANAAAALAQQTVTSTQGTDQQSQFRSPYQLDEVATLQSAAESTMPAETTSRPPISTTRIKTEAGASTNNSGIMSARLASARDLAMRMKVQDQVSGRDKLVDDINEMNGWGVKLSQRANDSGSKPEAFRINTDEAASIQEPSAEASLFDKYHSQMGLTRLRIGQINANNVVINVNNLTTHERALSAGAADIGTALASEAATSFRMRGSAALTSRFGTSAAEGPQEKAPIKQPRGPVNYVHKSPVPMSGIPITQASARWKYSAKDLWAEECFKQEFLRSIKTNAGLGLKTKQAGQHFFEQGDKKRPVPGLVRDEFTDFGQAQMTHEIFGEAASRGASRPGSNLTDHAFVVEDLVSGLKSDGLSKKAKALRRATTMNILKQIKIRTLQIEMSNLMNKKVLSLQEKALFQRRFGDLQSQLVDNMQVFDDTLKLKLMMNMDIVQQDKAIWDKIEQKMGAGRPVYSKPFFAKNCDQELLDMIETMQGLVAKLHVEPTHQAMKEVCDRESQVSNLLALRDQQEVELEDIRKVCECIRKILQRKSRVWQAHGRNDSTPGGGGESSRSKSTPRRSQTFRQLTDRGINIVGPVDTQQSSRGEKSPSSPFGTAGQGSSTMLNGNNTTNDYDEFNASYIVQLVTHYLMAVINKHMEMQELTITRQRLMQMRQYKHYREKVDEKYEELQVYFDMYKERTDKDIVYLKKKLEVSRAENDRLREVIQSRDLDIKVLSAKTGDMGYLNKLFDKMKGTLTELEEASESNAVGGKLIKGFLEKIDRLRDRKKREEAERRREEEEALAEAEEQALGVWGKVGVKGSTFRPMVKVKKLPTAKRRDGSSSDVGIAESPTSRSSRRAEAEGMINSMIMLAKRQGIDEEISRPIAEASVDFPDRFQRQISDVARTAAIAKGVLCKNCAGSIDGKTVVTSEELSSPNEPLSLRSRLARIPEDSGKPTSKSQGRGKASDDPLRKLQTKIAGDMKRKKPSPARRTHTSGNVVTQAINTSPLKPADLTQASDDESVDAAVEGEESGFQMKTTEQFGTQRRSSESRGQGPFQERPDTAGAVTLAREPMSSPEIDEEESELGGAYMINTASKIKVRKRRVVKDSSKHVLHVKAPKATSRDTSKENSPDTNLGRVNKHSKLTSIDASPESFPKEHKINFGRKTRENSGHASGTPSMGNTLTAIAIKSASSSGPDTTVMRSVGSARSRLSDAQVLRLVEAAMDELTLTAEKLTTDFTISQFPRSMPPFADYLRGYLTKQYGLERISSTYYKVIVERLASFAQPAENKYAQQLQSMIEASPVGGLGQQHSSIKAAADLNTTTLQTAPGQPESILKRESSARALDETPVPGQKVHFQHSWEATYAENYHRVVLYAARVFNDARNSSIGFTNKLMEAVPSPRGSASSITVASLQEILEHGGNGVSLFALVERVGRVLPLNPLSLRVIAKLMPSYLNGWVPRDTEEARQVYLKVAKMRVNHKLMQVGSEDEFWERLLMSRKESSSARSFDLDLLLMKLAERYAIYFTAMEQAAIKDTFYPELANKEMTIDESRHLQIHLRSPENVAGKGRMRSPKGRGGYPNDVFPPHARFFDEVMYMSEQEYVQNLQYYTCTKAEFIEMTLETWREYLEQTSNVVDLNLDTFALANRGESRQVSPAQLMSLLEHQLNINIKLAYAPTSSLPSKLLSQYGNPYKIDVSSVTKDETVTFYNGVIEHFGGKLTQEDVRILILKCNNEMIPFFRYILSVKSQQQ